jgi:hypothetical protein
MVQPPPLATVAVAHLVRTNLITSCAGCIAAVLLVRFWTADIAKLLAFRDSLASSSFFSTQRRVLTFHVVVSTDAAYPVNALRNIALDHASSSHVKAPFRHIDVDLSSLCRFFSLMLILSRRWGRVRLLLNDYGTSRGSARCLLFLRLTSLMEARMCPGTSLLLQTAGQSLFSIPRVHARMRRHSIHDGGHQRTHLLSLIRNGTKRICVMSRILLPLQASQNLTKGVDGLSPALTSSLFVFAE